ncbi:MAG: class I SAM-dependent methyltransferase [Candidatus Bathyarchaeia archaeon]
MGHTIRGELEGIIPDSLLDRVPSSFDILGSRRKAVAIIEVPEELSSYRGEIGDAITRVHKNVESVLERTSKRRGKYRTRELEVIYGEKDTEVIHKESGCLFKLDPQRVYFSARESTERERIVQRTSPGEDILVMFSGVGPFPICITKKVKGTKATAIEINHDAHNYCVENIHLNKVSDYVTPILGDVRDICPSLGKRYHRTLMPLPKGAYEFLDVAIPTVRCGGVLHLYHWAPEEDLWTEGEELVYGAVDRIGRKAEVLDRVKISQYSPRVYKIRLDVMVE